MLPFAGFSDPYLPYGNTRAFLDYGIMGFRECAAEIGHYLSNVEGVDAKEPLKMRVVNHLENLLSQKEIAINAAMAANSQVSLPTVAVPPLQTPMSVVSMPSVPTVSIPYAPLTPPRASPDNLSPPASFPEPLPRFSVAFPVPTTPIISLAPTNGPMPTVFHPAPSGFKPVIPAPISVVKPAPTVLPRPTVRPLTVITSSSSPSVTSTVSPISPPGPLDNMTVKLEMISTAVTLPKSPTKTPTNSTKAPFRPWADSMDITTNA